MAFSLSSSTLIIQFNTDTDLSGLSAISGVTTITSGTVTLYDIGNRQLSIFGTLDHDPDTEVLISDFRAPNNGTGSIQVISSNGVYNYGKTYTGANGIVGYASGTGIIQTGLATSGSSRPSVAVFNDATFNWSGGVINLASAFTVDTGAYFNVLSGTMNNINPNTSLQLRLKPSNASDNSRISVNGLTMTGTARGCVLFTTNAWASMVCNFGNSRVQTYNNAQPTLIIDDPDISLNRQTSFISFNMPVEANTSEVKIFNPSGELFASQSNSKFGIASSWRKIELTTFLNEALTSTEVAYYAKDINSGNRVSVNSIGYLSDQVYDGVTASGFANLGEVLIQVVTLKTGQLVVVDPRWTSATLPLNLWGYGYQYALVNVPLYGNFTKDLLVNMVADESITESSKTTVLTYATLETPQKLYDRSIAEIFPTSTSYVGQTSSTITRDGDLIDANDLDVVIDPNAVSAYSLVGTTLTFKSTLFAGGITTTGVITLSNNAKATGELIDANGTRFPDRIVSLTNLVVGSRIYVFDKTNNNALFNELATTTTFTGTVPTDGTDVDLLIRVRNASGAIKYKQFLTEATLTAAGVATTVNQPLDQ